MLSNTPSLTAENRDRAIETLVSLRRFTGAPGEFWPAFVSAAARLVGASRGILILRDAAQPERLRKLSEWTASGHASRSVLVFNRYLPELTAECVRSGQAVQVLEETAAEGSPVAVGVTLMFQGTTDKCVAAFLLENRTEQEAREALVRLQLAADLPFAYQVNQSAAQAKTEVEKFASVLDVMVLVNAEHRYLAAGLAFCNGLAMRFQCDRVSLGWLENGYVRLKCMSRTERFDKQMSAVQQLEAAMEEAIDQDEEIVWPQGEGHSQVTKDHEQFGRAQQVEHLCSIPLRLDGKGIGVLTCERGGKAFTSSELQQFRMLCDQAVRRLADLKRQDRWFGARWAMAVREKLAKVLGPEHTWAKVLALSGCVALVLSLLPIYPYRVEGDFVLRSDDVSYLTAPFDGFIKTVNVRPGDLLEANGELLRLDTDDLVIEESMAVADQARYEREAEKARAAGLLAEMRIAQALADQAKARVDLVRYRLERATVKAPFAGVVVEGDLRQRVGAPVKQGESLYKIARNDALYVEMEINQRYIHDILDKVTGEIAFVTQPKLKFPFRVTRIEPAAFPKDNENVFLVRGALEGPAESWWRPGMSGVSKLNVEKRTLLWILTHRTMDFLRMLFWW